MALRTIVADLSSSIVRGAIFALLPILANMPPQIVGGVLFGCSMFAFTSQTTAPVRASIMKRPALAQALIGLLLLALVASIVALTFMARR